MNNEQKKEYSKPEITIIEMGHEANLLQGSCVGEGCTNGEWID